jgi:hypothetical protein
VRQGRWALVFLVISTHYVWISDAEAGRYGVECTGVEDDVFEIDGMIDDWRGVRERKVAQGDEAMTIRCAASDRRLFLLVTVRDDRVIRNGPPRKPGQDQLRVAIGPGTGWSELSVLPGTRGFESVRTWLGKPVGGAVEVQDSLQEDGWSMEAALPLQQLRGHGPGTPKLEYRITYADVDDRGKPAQRHAAGTIRFPGATAVYLAFMRQTGLRRSDVTLDTLVNVDRAAGVERVIAGGNIVGILSDEFRYLTLPVQSAKDVLGVKVVDLGGHGRSSIVTQYRQHGNGGSRDVVAIWNVGGNGAFERGLAFEVRKQMGQYLLTNEWRLQAPGASKKRGGKGKRAARRGLDLVVEVGEVRGWDEDSFHDQPPADMRGILTPWGEQQSAVYHFEGEQSFGGAPLPK